MSEREPKLREMRATDMVRFSRVKLPQFYGVVVELDGREIGAAAVFWGDKKDRRPFLCLEITDELRTRPLFMNRVGKAIIAAAVKASGRLYTIESADEPTASRWLNWLGFEPTGETIKGERVLRWQQSLPH